MRPPTTAEVQSTTAFPLGEFGCQRIVDWATNRLVDGDDTEALRILAGLTTPFNLFEVAARRDKVLAERNLLVPKDQAISLYARELVRDLVEPACNLKSTLQTLFQLHVDCEYESALQDFYLLDCAREDLEYGTFSYHWMDVTRENFRRVCKEAAAKWLAEHPIDPPHTSVR